jgi:hypothetical protein
MHNLYPLPSTCPIPASRSSYFSKARLLIVSKLQPRIADRITNQPLGKANNRIPSGSFAQVFDQCRDGEADKHQNQNHPKPTEPHPEAHSEVVVHLNPPRLKTTCLQPKSLGNNYPCRPRRSRHRPLTLAFLCCCYLDLRHPKLASHRGSPNLYT